MYKKILLATDGSDLSEVAQSHAIALAKAFGSSVVVIYATPPWSSLVVGDAVVMYPPDDYEQTMDAAAQKLLGKVSDAFKAAGISVEAVHNTDPQAHKAIVETAKAKGCDLIVMGSHGRHGIAGLMLGSVANKTVTHAHVPVLICRT
ncbi:MAG: universal stress protein UspA [Hyphomicrobium sp.]|jgi:nucleotide-binding universal stress UspA family protein|nr:universal stress protein UspA [Hyphomicrobium sp.]PPD09019.1 MAG: universal stress protein UspA [Hyphomicrobium sp.]